MTSGNRAAKGFQATIHPIREARIYMVNHGSLICSNLNPICFDLSQLRHLQHLSYLRHLRHLCHCHLRHLCYLQALCDVVERSGRFVIF
jgi:hypothetical protein